MNSDIFFLGGMNSNIIDMYKKRIIL